MSKKIQVTEGVFIEVLRPGEVEHSLVFIVFDDPDNRQCVPIFACEIKVLIAALTEAAVMIADQMGGADDK
jgi:hypothetical protein